MTSTNFALSSDDCEWHGAKKNKLAVESLFLQLCTGFKITRYLGRFWFFRCGLGNKNFYFWPYNLYPWWTGPARPGPARPNSTRPWFFLTGYFCNIFFLQTRMGRYFILGMDFMVKNKYFLSHKAHRKKINSFRDIALFEIPNITLKTSSRLQARSSSLHVTHNYHTEGQSLIKSYISNFD